MPLSTSRLSRQGRPRPSARRGISPISGSNTAHCSSVRSMALHPPDGCSLPPIYEMACSRGVLRNACRTTVSYDHDGRQWTCTHPMAPREAPEG